MSLKRNVMSGLRWTAGAKFLMQLITWSITIVVIRLLTPVDYGLMELAAVFVAFLALLNELGLGAAVIQKKDLDQKTLNSLFGFVLFASIVFYFFLSIAAPFISDFYQEPRLIRLIRVLALQFLFMGFTVMPQSLLLREMAFRKIATIDFISAISGSITTLILALNGQGVWALVWGNLIIRVVSMIGLNLAKPFLHLPQFTINNMGAIFSFGSYVTLSRILWYFYSRADILIIGKVLGKDLLGVYSVGMYLAALPMEKFTSVINQVAFPAFSSVQTEPGMAGRYFLKAVRVMSFFAFPVLWGISSIAPEIVDIFLGSKWSGASLSLRIVALVIPLRMIGNLMNPTLLGAGRPEVSVVNTLSACLVMPVAFWIGSFWGLLGVSLAWVIAFPFVFCINLSRVAKILGISCGDVFKSMVTPLISGLIMYLCVEMLKYIHIENISVNMKLLILVVCGFLSYACMTILFNRRGFQEIRGLID